MAQSQLLLLLLGIVVVGTAVLGGVTAFQHVSRRAVADQLASEGMQVAGSILAWKAKPALLGGGAGTPGLRDFTFDRLRQAETTAGGTVYRGAFGTFRLARRLGTNPVLVGRAYGDTNIQTRLVLFGLGENCVVPVGDGFPTDSLTERDITTLRPANCNGV